MPLRNQFETEAEWLEHLRLYFAGQALIGLVTTPETDDATFDEIATRSWNLADAMLRQRSAS